MAWLLLLMVVVVPEGALAEGKRFFDLSGVRSGGIAAGQFVSKKKGFFAMNNYKTYTTPVSTKLTAKNATPEIHLASLSKEVEQLSDKREPEAVLRDSSLGEEKLTHQWPLPGYATQRISSHFGYRADPLHGRRAFHAGVDIAAAVGTKVLASAPGVVRFAGVGKGLGKYVKLAHADGSYSIYGHLGHIAARSGQSVRLGEVIGRIGMTGRTTGPHLHYGIKQGESLVNPLARLSPPEAIRSRYAELFPPKAPFITR